MKKRLILLACVLALFSGCGKRENAVTVVPSASAAAETAMSAEPTPTSAPTPTPLPTPSPIPTPSPVPTPCPHLLWVDGVCADCGAVCAHPAWENGQCTECAVSCSHPTHDRETLICPQCGQTVPHNFLHSQCGMCGLKPAFTERVLDLKYFYAAKETGTVETREYMTHDYFTEGRTWGYAPLKKKLCVYLPSGYDPAEKYDVLILLHGSGGSENYWLRDAQQITNSPGYGVYTVNMLDNLMASGYCRKMIVVTPTFYRDSGSPGDYSRDIDEEQFVRELCSDILPFIVETYSTYARSGAREDIAAARAHFAYAGLSMGSIYAYTSVIPQYLDLFGWFGCFSGSDAHMDELIRAMHSEKNAALPIYYFYNSIGAKDSMYDTHFNEYHQLCASVDSLTDGDNAAFTTIGMCSHDYRAWGTGLYNFLRVVFAQPAEK